MGNDWASYLAVILTVLFLWIAVWGSLIAVCLFRKWRKKS